MINELKILENELGFIPVYQTEKGAKVVYGRDLYEGLGVSKNTRFIHWINDSLEDVDAIEDKDYFTFWYKTSDVFKTPCQFNGNVKSMNAKGCSMEYIIKLEIAKEVCIVAGASNNAGEELKAKSKEYRRYLIRVEEKYKEMIVTPSYMIEDPIARAKAWIVEQEEKQALENKVSEMQVRVDYLDKIQGYGNAITTKTIAVDYGMSSVAFNKLLHELHIQYKQGKVWYLYQEHKGNGYEVVTYYKDKPQMKWTLKGAEWLYHILKENGYLPILEK